jgi:hypothetical protein
MESRTERLLRALGTRETYAIVRALLEMERTTSALSVATKLSTGALERELEALSQGSVVSRRPGGQGAWYIAHWPETFAILQATRQLGIAIAGSEDHADGRERELFVRLEQAGGAAAAAKRGRRSQDDDR